MNKILKALVNKRSELVDEHKREIKELEKFMKKFIFLFRTNPYTDAHEFSYQDKHDEKWFANMTYYPSSGTCSINTGTYHPEDHLIGGYTRFDKIPDINKLQKAIRIVMEKRNEGTAERIKRMKNVRSILGGIKL